MQNHEVVRLLTAVFFGAKLAIKGALRLLRLAPFVGTRDLVLQIDLSMNRLVVFLLVPALLLDDAWEIRLK